MCSLIRVNINYKVDRTPQEREANPSVSNYELKTMSPVHRSTASAMSAAGWIRHVQLTKALKLHKWLRSRLRLEFNRWPSKFLVNCILLANAIVIMAPVANGSRGIELQEYRDAGVVFSTFFLIEIGLRWYAFGNRYLLKDSGEVKYWAVIEAAVVIISFVVDIVDATSSNNKIVKSLLLLRLIRFLRIIESVQSYRVLFSTARNVLPALATFGIILYTELLIFAFFGMSVYSGKVPHQLGDGADSRRSRSFQQTCSFKLFGKPIGSRRRHHL